MPYGEKELQSFLDRHGLAAEILHLEHPVKKVEDAEAAIGVDRTNIVKAMVLMIDESEPLLCIVRGDCRLDFGKVSDAVGTANVRFASRKETLSHIGYDIGGIPPVGHQEVVRTLVDNKVGENSVVYGGGGSDKCLLKIEVADIVRFEQVRCLDIT